MSGNGTTDCQDRYHDDLAVYALGALEGADAQALEQHLDGCEACSERLRWLRPAVDLMPASVPQLEAPEALKRSLMQIVNEEAAAAAPAPATEPAPSLGERLRSWLPRTGFRPALAGLAATALVVAAIGGYALHGDDSDGVRSIEAAPIAQSSGATGFVRLEGGAGDLYVEDMPPTSRDSVYQVWVREGEDVAPSSTFEPARDGSGHATIADVPSGADEIMVTREPTGGSQTPRGPVVMSAHLT